MIDDAEGLPDEEMPVPQGYPEQRRPLRRGVEKRKGNPNRNVRKAYASKGDDATFSRWVKVKRPEPVRQPALLESPRVVDPKLLRRPAIVAGRSVFHAKGVKAVAEVGNVLVSGHSNVKIGRDVRWSNGRDDEDCAVPVRAVDEAVNAIVCPEQTGKADGCGKCGLCWGTRRNIAFLEH